MRAKRKTSERARSLKNGDKEREGRFRRSRRPRAFLSLRDFLQDQGRELGETGSENGGGEGGGKRCERKTPTLSPPGEDGVAEGGKKRVFGGCERLHLPAKRRT